MTNTRIMIDCDFADFTEVMARLKATFGSKAAPRVKVSSYIAMEYVEEPEEAPVVLPMSVVKEEILEEVLQELESFTTPIKQEQWDMEF